MLDVISRLVAGLAVFGLLVGLYHLLEGTALVGGYLIGASVGALVTAALLDGLSRGIGELERTRKEIRRWRLEGTDGTR